jgi:hypothetical protein
MRPKSYTNRALKVRISELARVMCWVVWLLWLVLALVLPYDRTLWRELFVGVWWILMGVAIWMITEDRRPSWFDRFKRARK